MLHKRPTVSAAQGWSSKEPQEPEPEPAADAAGEPFHAVCEEAEPVAAGGVGLVEAAGVDSTST